MAQSDAAPDLAAGAEPAPTRSDPIRPDQIRRRRPALCTITRRGPSRVVAATGSLTRRVANGMSPGVHHPFHSDLQRARRSVWCWLGRDDSGSG
jgi:hypothetical protein